MFRRMRFVLAILGAVSLLAVTATVASAHDPTGGQAESLKGRLYDGVVQDPSPGGVPMEAMSDVRCRGGKAGIFPCHKVDLASFTPLVDVGSTFVNDVWGWEDAATGMQVAIVGSMEGTIFMDVTDGTNPVHLGTLASAVPGVFENLWGDIRVHENTAYIGSEAVDFSDFSGAGVQVVDMTQFRGATGPIGISQGTPIDDMTNSHNLSVNTDSGRLYVTGSFIGLRECQVEPHPSNPPFINGTGAAMIYDVDTDPMNPTFMGCLTGDGYTHDLQCVTYHGPDPDHQGSEICVGSNEAALTLYDASDPANPVVLSRQTYLDVPFFDPEAGHPNYYTHQGWLTEDHQYFFLGDELDEFFGGSETRNTYIWDMTDLDNATLLDVNNADNSSIDHNMFVHEGLLYQSNYAAGLVIYDTWKAEQGRMTERGYFDTFPASDITDFYGSWGNYPYFGDGKVIVTSSDEGIFVLDSRAKSSDNTFARGNR